MDLVITNLTDVLPEICHSHRSNTVKRPAEYLHYIETKEEAVLWACIRGGWADFYPIYCDGIGQDAGWWADRIWYYKAPLNIDGSTLLEKFATEPLEIRIYYTEDGVRKCRLTTKINEHGKDECIYPPTQDEILEQIFITKVAYPSQRSWSVCARHTTAKLRTKLKFLPNDHRS